MTKIDKKFLVFETEVKYKGCTGIKTETINSSKIVYSFIEKIIEDKEINVKEYFFLICLNRNNQIIGYSTISEGGISGTVVDIRLIAKQSIDLLASGVILAHNHPSGNLKISSQDKDTTNKVKKGLELLDIKLIDHIVFSNEGYKSFLDEGLL